MARAQANLLAMLLCHQPPGNGGFAAIQGPSYFGIRFFGCVTPVLAVGQEVRLISKPNIVNKSYFVLLKGGICRLSNIETDP